METPQIIALSVGLGAAAIAALFAFATLKEKKRVLARTLELFAKGASSAEIVPHLVAEGFDQATATAVVEKAARRIMLGHPTSMLEAGHSRADILKDMVGRGLDPEQAEELIGEAALLRWAHRWRFLLLPAGLALCLAGAGICFFGLVVRDGNRSGKWVTFPYAGGLTIMAGVFVLAMGITLVGVVFAKTL